MQMKHFYELPSADSFDGNDIFAIEIDGVTYKVQASVLAQALQTIGSYVGQSDIIDDLTHTDADKVLSARQGKALNDGKLDKANVYNGLDKTVEGFALDARQGKALNDGKLDKANVYNGLDKTVEGFALDARQGKALADLITNHAVHVGEYQLTTAATQTFQDAALDEDMVILAHYTSDDISLHVTPTVVAGELTLTGTVSDATTLTLYWGRKA